MTLEVQGSRAPAPLAIALNDLPGVLEVTTTDLARQGESASAYFVEARGLGIRVPVVVVSPDRGADWPRSTHGAPLRHATV